MGNTNCFPSKQGQKREPAKVDSSVTSKADSSRVASVTPNTASPVKSVRDLDLSAKVFIITHGGCPDGQASAYILRGAVQALSPKTDVQVIQGAHSGRITPVDIAFGDSTVVFVDICPLEADADVISSARQVVVLDHHPTAESQMAPLKAQFGEKINDLSTNDGKACGASLAQAFCDGVFAMDNDALELHWKLDVFQHPLAKDLEPHLNAFKGWINQKGARDCDMALVEQFAKDKEGCLKRGDALYEPVRVNTRKTAAARRLVHEEQGLKVYAVDVDAVKAQGHITDDPIDPMVYQDEIDKLKEKNVAVPFITIERKLNPKTKAWNLGLRRAGEYVDMGKVASALKEDATSEGFVSGGGHAFAAGAQCTNAEIKMDDLVRVVAAACKRSLVTPSA